MKPALPPQTATVRVAQSTYQAELTHLSAHEEAAAAYMLHHDCTERSDPKGKPLDDQGFSVAAPVGLEPTWQCNLHIKLLPSVPTTGILMLARIHLV